MDKFYKYLIVNAFEIINWNSKTILKNLTILNIMFCIFSFEHNFIKL